MDSQTLLTIGITVAVCGLIAIGVWIAVNQRRSRRLKEQFGPEYDRVVERSGNRTSAEEELQQREERVKEYKIVALSEHDRTHYQHAWDRVQNRFVDDPRGAAMEADELIFEVMERRGYPVNGFEQAAADLSVDHAVVVENYRAASAIAQRNRQGEAGTEDLRQALVYYRALFHDLLQAPSSDKPRTAAATHRAKRAQSHNRKNNRGGLRA
jgi:FtsZ-interacting cell division protein ZipA